MTPMNRIVAILSATATALTLTLASALPAHADREDANRQRLLMQELARRNAEQQQSRDDRRHDRADDGHDRRRDDRGDGRRDRDHRDGRRTLRDRGHGWDGRRDLRPDYYGSSPYYRREQFAGIRLPADCAVRVQGPNNAFRSYGETCLAERGIRRGLPFACAKNVVLHGRHDRVFPLSCLKSAGFYEGPPRHY